MQWDIKKVRQLLLKKGQTYNVVPSEEQHKSNYKYSLYTTEDK